MDEKSDMRKAKREKKKKKEWTEEQRKKKEKWKKKTAPSDKYESHKQCEKYWVMASEWWY